jgi:hypothetical protein
MRAGRSESTKEKGKGFGMTVSAPVQLPGMSQAGPEQKSITRLIVATSIGNALEWYDIAVYGYFAVYISKAFFPNNDPTTSLLLTFGTFGLSFLIRPIGGVVLGAYADRHGRKASLMISIVLMTVGTLAVAFMPTYETIGILAPIVVFTARLVQGFSAGGEFGSSTAFLVEHAPERLHRELAICQPGAEHAVGVCVWRRAHSVDDSSRDAVMGLANSVFVRGPGRTGRHLHSQQPRGRNRATGGETGLPGQASLLAPKAWRDPKHRRARDINRGQLPHRLHADLCG